MSLKTKLISSISAFVLVLALLVVGVFALPQANVPLGGTINFQATSVYAEITGTISGQENGPASLPKLEFSNGQTPDTSGWAKGDLIFDPNASPIQIQIAINVKNLSERSLFVKVDDLVGAVTNLTKSVMVGAEDQEGAYVEVLPGQSVDYVISLSPTDEGEPVTGEYNYLITLIDESETQDIEIQANPNMETLGSVSGGGTFDLGDTVTLTATRSGSNTFLAWATSTDPNTMEILSTSSTYSFELTMDSPRTYYALFNKTTSIKQTVGNLIYTFYNEAKLASVTDTTSTSLSGALEIPSVVSNGENSYKVYSIGNYAFSSCSSLTSITIPEGVTSIGTGAFLYCSSLEAFYGTGNSYYTIDDNRALVVDGGKTLLAYAAANSATSYLIPEGVTSIGGATFYSCRNLTSVTLPSTVTSIGAEPFCDCGSLEAIYGAGNSYYTNDDNRALIVDGGERLLAYAIANPAASYSIPEGVTSIGNNVFRNCSILTSITIPEGVTSIGLGAFQSCSSLVSITIPEGVTSINDLTFSGCSSLASVTIPKRVTSIGHYAFSSCSSLTEITIPEGVTSIGQSAFDYCIGLTEITINGNISTLGSGAFRYCTNLTKLTLGANVESIPSNLFSSNMLTRLTEIVVEAGPSLSAALPTYAKWYKDDDPTEVTNFSGAGTYSTTQPSLSVTIAANNDGLGSISGGGEFEYGDTVTLAATVSGSNTFLAWATSLDPSTMKIVSTSPSYSFQLTQDSPRTYYAIFNSETLTNQSADGDSSLRFTLYTDAKLAMITRAITKPTGDYTVPSTIQVSSETYKVFAIGDDVFSSSPALTSVVIPEGITSIGENAFDTCSAMTSVTLPSTLVTIGEYAFTYCRGLTTITIPEGVTTIGDYAFNNCTNLVSISLPSTLSSIDSPAFAQCTGLASISVAEGNTNFMVDQGAALISSEGNLIYFAGMNSTITEYTIPSNVTQINEGAFTNCPNLTSIIIPSTVETIQQQAFQTCSNVTYVYYDSTYSGRSSSGLFSRYFGSSNGFEIEFGPNVKTILHFISRNDNLTSVVFSEDCPITMIGTDAFQYCDGLKNFTIPSSVKTIGMSAFYNSGIEELTINGNITSMQSSAFQGCDALTKLTLGEDVTSLVSTIFSSGRLTNLNEIVVLGDLRSETFPSGTWLKDGVVVTSFTGAGTYTKQA